MELDAFISGTIKSIIKSINDTKDFAEKNGAIVNPLMAENKFESKSIRKKDDKIERRVVTKIDFDIAVASSEEKTGEINIQVLGLSTPNTEANQTASRIKFSLNVALPHQLEE